MRTRSVNVVRWWAAGILLAAALAAPPPGAARQGAPGDRAAPVLPGPPQSEDERALVVNADLVTFTVTVTDREGRHVGGLERGDFTVLDDGVPQEISFFSDDDAPASVAVVFDTSASMKGDKITRALEALARLIETSHDRDEFFVIAFNSLAQLLVERTRDA